jgi:alkaline phosphatase D
LDVAMRYVRRAVNNGLPFGRWYAGPRNLLQPLLATAAFKKYAAHHPIRLVHGPLVGAVSSNTAHFLVRTPDEATVTILASTTKGFANSITSSKVRTRAQADFTATVELTGLQSDTRYVYQVWVNGAPADIEWLPSFRTFPERGEKGVQRIAFGGGAGYTPWNERMWDTLRRRGPQAILMLGDNVYIDHPEVPEVQQYCYYRRLSHPTFRRFAANTPIYAIWDDHDFAVNDHPGGGPDPESPAWKRPVLKVFKENVTNPYYGGGQQWPGVWHDFSVGDVDFFLLDCRFYRTDATKPNPTMLGPVQKQWLLNKLRASTATFKIIASSVPWAFGTKGGRTTRDDGTVISRGIDTWEGFPKEREEIFRHIEENKINGVFLLSADRHRSDFRRIEREAGYDLYDAMSSKLTNNKSHSLVEGALFGYNEECSFGWLTFDTAKSDPELRYDIVNIEDEVIHSKTLKLSQLSFVK